MQDTLRTYALVTAFFDKNQSIIGTFVPFVVRVLSRERSLDIASIQTMVSANYKVQVPTHVLQTVLQRALKSDLVASDSDRKRWSLTAKGETYSDALESEDDVSRRISDLLEDAARYFQDAGSPKSSDQVYELICGIARENSAVLEQYMSSTDSIGATSYHGGEGDREVLLGYVRSAPAAHFRTLQDVIYGSLLIGVVHSNDPTMLNELQDRRFRSTVLYLDTNYLLAVLGFENPNTVKPAKELFTLVKEFGLRPRVFDFTLDELARVLNRCIGEFDSGTTAVAGSQLGAELRRQGVSRSQLVRFIADMESRTEELGIETELTDIGDVAKYVAKSKTVEEAVSDAKPNQGKAARNHDIAAIERVRSARRKQVHALEDAGFLLLTSDGKLANCVLHDMGHSARGTVGEAILDRLLTNILWIKKPDWEFPLESVIAAHSHTLFVQRSVWNKFVDVLHNMRESGSIEEADVTVLFYRDYIENAMASDHDLQPDAIDPNYIERHLAEAKQLRADDVASMRAEADAAAAAAANGLHQAVGTARSEVESDWLKKMRQSRADARTSSVRWAESVYGYATWAAILMLAFAAWMVYWKLSEIKVAGPLALAATAIGLAVRLLAPTLGWRQSAIQGLAAKRYKRLVAFLPEAPELTEPA